MKNLTIRLKFLIIIAVLFLAASFAILTIFSGVTTRIINEFALLVATKQALHDRNRIHTLIDREVVLAQKMSDDGVIRNWAERGSASLRPAAMEQLESYRRLFRDRSYFIALDSTRLFYAAGREDKPEQPKVVPISADNPADKWYFETIKNVDTFALNLDYDKAFRQTKVWVNVVMYGKQGARIGICGSGIDLTDFLNEIVHSKEPGGGDHPGGWQRGDTGP